MAAGNSIQAMQPMQATKPIGPLPPTKTGTSMFSGYDPAKQGLSSGTISMGSKGSSQPQSFTGYSQNYAMPNKTVSGIPVKDPYYEQFKTASAKEQQNYAGKSLTGQPIYAGQQQPIQGPSTNIGGNWFTADMPGLPGHAMDGTGPLTNKYLEMPDPQTASIYKNPAKPKDDELLKRQQMAYQQQMGYIQQPNSPMQFGNSPYTNQGYQGGTLLQLLGRLFGGF